MPTCGATSSVPLRSSTIPCQGSPRRTAMPTSTVKTRSLKSAVASRGVATSFRRFGSASGGCVASSRWYSASAGRPARGLLGADLGDGRTERAVADDLVRVDGFRHVEPLPGQHADHRVDVRDHALHPERTVEELSEHRRLGDERVVAVAGPLQQPRGPVLPVVDRHLDLRGGVLGPEAHEVVATLHVVVQPGHAHAEAVGDGLHRHAVEPDLVRGAGDHRPVDARGPADLGPGRPGELVHAPPAFPNKFERVFEEGT